MVGRYLKQLAYLPHYSPDPNTIEVAFSKVKRLLRVTRARTKEALVEAVGKALDTVGASDARGFFAYRGYGGSGQQPSKMVVISFVPCGYSTTNGEEEGNRGMGAGG
jgi:hypothetical protein